MTDSIEAWIDRNAHPLTQTTPDGPLTDLAPLADVVGDAAIVGLGETTRAGRAIMVLGHRVVRFLVE